MDIGCFNSYLEVDLSVVRRAMKTVKAYIEPHVGIIPVIKANAYGMGTVRMAQFMLEFALEMIACAQMCEAVELRRAGIACELLVMGGVPENAVPAALEYGVQIPLFDRRTAKILSDHARAAGKTAKAHIKIESGMHRIGVCIGQPLEDLLDYIKALGSIEIDGVFTHFATATTVESPFTYEQFEIFKKGVAQLSARGITPRFIHCRNTGAASWFREDISTHIRAGSLLFGFPGMDDDSNLLSLGREPESWRAFITNITDLRPGESCGYGRFFMADKPTRVATIDIGYADGLFKPLVFSRGPVLVRDTRTVYLGGAMDQSFVDVTGIDCKIGDEVTVFGYSQNGAPLELAELEKIIGHTMAYLQVTVNQRVKRIYINSSEEI